MKELVKFLICRLAESGERAEIVEEGNEITVYIDKADMGKVIGKQGKIIKSIRTLVRSVGAKTGKKYNVEIKEKINE